MSDEYEDDDCENIDEEDQLKKDAQLSSALKRIMQQSGSASKNLTKYEKTKKDWNLLGIHNRMEFYLGSICSEVMYKFPKTYKGKVMLWDDCIRFFKNEQLVGMYVLQYIGGFRENVTDAVDRLSSQYSE